MSLKWSFYVEICLLATIVEIGSSDRSDYKGIISRCLACLKFEILSFCSTFSFSSWRKPNVADLEIFKRFLNFVDSDRKDLTSDSAISVVTDLWLLNLGQKRFGYFNLAILPIEVNIYLLIGPSSSSIRLSMLWRLGLSPSMQTESFWSKFSYWPNLDDS